MRVFVALDIPDAVRTAISDLVLKLRPLCRNARWVRIESAHVTLKFIGEVPPDKVEAVKAVLAPLRTHNPIEMKFRNVGFFPDERRPRVFWAGIEAGPALGELAAAMETALEPLGIAREQRAFSPHLTLARFESPNRLDRLRDAIAAAGPLEFGRTVAEEFHLYQSVLKRGGAEYTRLVTFCFEGGVPR
jgi:2'-5' RNA ligase